MEITDIILEHPEVLGRRDFIIDAFSITTHSTKEEVRAEDWYIGKVYMHNNKLMVHLPDDQDVELEDTKQPYTSFEQEGTLPVGVLKNTTKPMKTTIGKVALNYLLLSEPFGDVIPYVNGPWDSDAIERDIVNALVSGKISVADGYQYVDNVYYLGSYSDFCVPSLSEKAVSVDPSVIKRRDELFKKYKGQLDDPKIMMLIESELIDLDIATMNGDVSNGFMTTRATYSNQRKRMFLTVGMVSKFGGAPGHDFIQSSLDDGWDMNDFPKVANEIRGGSYSRGMETAKGGDIAKQIGRRFQETSIVMDDCETPTTFKIAIDDHNKDEYMYRNIVVRGALVELNEDNITKFIGKTVNMRTPMSCIAKNGYCYACMDTRFKKLEVTLLNTQLLQIGSKIMLNSMKAMHVVIVTAYELDSFDEFVV